MALDHYVSQVHLRNFYSPALDGRMYAMRKSDLKAFQCDSKSVCRIEDGNTNPYLAEERAIEEFLVDVEPKYTASVSKLRQGNIDRECIRAIAGFVGYVGSCSPAAMRIHTGPLHGLLESEAAILDRQGLIPKAPAALEGKTLPELLEEGAVRYSVDQKYPQALGISTIVDRVSIFGNSKWEILLNTAARSPFFTSDFPVALEAASGLSVNWVVPLAPDLAIRIVPDVGLARAPVDLSFAKFTSKRRTLGYTGIVEINRLIVRCAEDLVFYRDDLNWVRRFVAKNRDYRIETVTERIPYGTGFMNVSKQIVSPRREPRTQ